MPTEKLLKEGEALFQAGRKAEAEALFRAVLEREPAHSRAANNLAVMALADGRRAEAEALLAGVLARDPRDQPALDNLLNLCLMEKKWLEARAVAGDLLALRPDDVRVLKIAVRAALAREFYAEARNRADRLLALAPDDPEVLELSALIRFKSGDPEGASRELSLVLAADPGRTDLAVRLALLNNPGVRTEADLWPNPADHPPLDQARLYRRTWSGLKVSDPVIRTAQTLGRLDDPGSLADEDLPLNPARPPQPIGPAPDRKAADVSGLSIMFAPTIIAGQSAIMARWLRERGVKTINVEIAKSYLGYQADYYYPEKLPEIHSFVDLMMNKAAKQDILCLDFGSSLQYFPNFVSRIDYRREKTPGQPYADLLALKDKGVKIFFQFWGSDHTSQSIFAYYYLDYLGFEGLPRPPFQTRYLHRNVAAAAEAADAFMTVDLGLGLLPGQVPFFDVVIEPDRWPLKTSYRPRVERILTAPTNARKKNYSLIQGALTSFQARRPEVRPFRVHNTPHDQVPPLYADADLGLDQAGYGFGTFSLEMMALGLPVVSALNPPPPGWRAQAPVLSFRNIRELEARLEECAARPESLPELGRQGRDYVMRYHTPEVVGAAFSRYMAEAVSGGPVSQAPQAGYEKNIRLWDRDPEKVRAFRFYDVAVPLFCALAEFEYAAQLCLDAMDCDWRDEKFLAWHRAITEAGKMAIPLYKQLPETENLARETALRRQQLQSSRALVEEYLGQLAEAESLPE